MKDSRYKLVLCVKYVIYHHQNIVLTLPRYNQYDTLRGTATSTKREWWNDRFPYACSTLTEVPNTRDISLGL